MIVGLGTKVGSESVKHAQLNSYLGTILYSKMTLHVDFGSESGKHAHTKNSLVPSPASIPTHIIS